MQRCDTSWHGRIVAAACGVFAAGLIACTEPTAPSAFAGDFRLTRVGGQPLPAPGGAGQGVPLVFAGALQIRAGGSGGGLIVTQTTVRQGAGGTADTTSRRHDAFVRNDTLVIRWCPIDAACLAVVLPDISGVLSKDTLRLLPWPAAPAPEFLYVRSK